MVELNDPAGPDVSIDFYLYFYFWVPSSWSLTAPEFPNGVEYAEAGLNAHKISVPMAEGETAKTFDAVFTNPFLIERAVVMVYSAPVTLANSLTTNPLVTAYWESAEVPPPTETWSTIQTDITTQDSGLFIEPPTNIPDADTSVFTRVTWSPSPDLPTTNAYHPAAYNNETLKIKSQFTEAVLHQQRTTCHATYIARIPNPAPAAFALRIAKMPGVTKPTFWSEPEFMLPHAQFSDAFFYSIACLYAQRPFHDRQYSTTMIANQPALAYPGLGGWEEFSSMVMVNSLPPPTIALASSQPITAGNWCETPDFVRRHLAFSRDVMLYPGDAFFFGVDPLADVLDARHPGNWDLYSPINSVCSFTNTTISGYFHFSSDKRGVYATVREDVAGFVLPTGVSFTCQWATGRWDVATITPRAAHATYNDLNVALILQGTDGATFNPITAPYWIAEKVISSFYTCDEPNAVALSWSVESVTGNPYGAFYELKVAAFVPYNNIIDELIATPTFTPTISITTGSPIRLGQEIQNGNAFMAMVRPQALSPFDTTNMTVQFGTKTNDAGYDSARMDLVFALTYPEDIHTNPALYNNTLINLRLRCVLSPHPSILTETFNSVFANTAPSRTDSYSLGTVSFPRHGDITRPEGADDAQLDVVFSIAENEPFLRGEEVAMNITLSAPLGGDDVCIYPGTAVIVDANEDSCFTNVQCLTTPIAPHYLDTRSVVPSNLTNHVVIFGGSSAATEGMVWRSKKADSPVIMTIPCTATITASPTLAMCTASFSLALPLRDLGNVQQQELPFAQQVTSTLTPLRTTRNLSDLTREYAWQCQVHPTSPWVDCDESFEAAVKAQYECLTSDCRCNYTSAPQCFDLLNPNTPVASSYCAALPPPTAPATISVDHAAKCAMCTKTIATLYNWGALCDIKPNITHFGYAIVGTLAETTADYSQRIQFDIKYIGSPTNQVVFFAQSSSFSPFKTIALFSTPIPTTTIQPDANGVYSWSLTYSLKDLGVDAGLQGLTFFATVGQGVTSPTTGTSNGLRPTLTILSRCQDPTNPTSLTGRCANGGECDATRGVCNCGVNSIWSGDLCKDSICDTLGCVDQNTATTGDKCEIVTTNGVKTPQCRCADTTRFEGTRCEVEKECSAQSTMQSCVAPNGFPALNDTTKSCQCACQGQWSTTNAKMPCKQCNLRCLNNGKDYSNCQSPTCTCPSSGNALYYGASCQCKGVVLRTTLPIDSERFEVIRAKREEVAQLLIASKEAQASNDILSFLKRDAFTSFIHSFLQAIVVDYRDELIKNGVNTASLYVKDENGVEQINSRSVSQIVSLKDFNVASKAGSDGVMRYDVSFTLLVIALPQCYTTESSIDDTNWTSALTHMNTVATYLEKDETTPTSSPEDGTDGKVTVQVYDPLCENVSCTRDKTNTASTHHTNQSVTLVILSLVAVFFLCTTF